MKISLSVRLIIGCPYMCSGKNSNFFFLLIRTFVIEIASIIERASVYWTVYTPSVPFLQVTH